MCTAAVKARHGPGGQAQAALGDRHGGTARRDRHSPEGQPSGTGTVLGDSPMAQDRWIWRAGQRG